MNTTVRNLDSLLAGTDDLWAPRIAGTVNDHAVKVAAVRGEHVWHAHHDTDELFVVLSGELEIVLRDGGSGPGAESVVRLRSRDVHVVPRGVEHRPRSTGGATLLLVESAGTLSTGDFDGPLPAHLTSTTGAPDELPHRPRGV